MTSTPDRREGETARPEAALLLCCARTRLDAGRVADLLSPKMDWEFLLSLARQHGIGPLLHRALTMAGSDRVPPEVMDDLRAEYHANAAHSLLLLAETERLLVAFGTAGIEAAPLRGPVLALSAYGDIALRKSVDVDLLVRLDDVLAAIRVLAAEGYRQEEQVELTGVQRRALIGLGHHERFVGQKGAVEVELHWRPVSLAVSPRPEEWRLLEQRRPVAHGGGEIRALTPEWCLLLCCAHGYSHVFCCLKWVCDIAELARTSPGLDYHRAEAEAHRLGCVRAVFIGCLLAADLLGAPLPDWLLARASADRPASRFAAEVARRVRCGEDHGTDVLTRLRDLRLQLQAAGPLRSRACYLLRRIGTQSKQDIASLRLPRPLSLLYGLAKLGRPWQRHRRDLRAR